MNKNNNFNLEYIFFFLIFIWILNFFFTLYTLPPNVDDALYFTQSFFFSYTNELAYKDGLNTYYDFSKFPVFPLFQGFFLKFLLFINFPIDFYSYRIFTLIIFIFLIFCSFKLINSFIQEKELLILLKCLFLVLISISPFSLNYMIVRPELLGLSFLILGLYFYRLYKDSGKITNFFQEKHIFISGILISLSIFTHPMFFLINFFLIIFILINDFKIKIFLFFALGLFIPFFVIASYYIYHLPYSLEQLLINSSGFPYFGYFFSYIQTIFFENNIYMNLINAFYHIPYFLIFLYLIFLYLKKLIKKNNFEYYEKINFVLIFSIFITFFIERSTYYNHSVFAIIILLILFYEFRKINFNFSRIIFFNYKLFVVLSIFCIFSWNIFHTLKYYLFKDQYLSNSKFINFKNSFLKNKKIFITRSEFIPYFLDEIELNISSNFNNQSTIDWFFPISSRAVTLNEINRSKNIIEKKLRINNLSDYHWIIAKKNILNDNNQNMCIRLDIISPENIDISLNHYSMSYETKKYIVLNSKEISLECDIT